MVKLDYARLKNIRLEQDITQKELATATGVNLSTIKQIETGRSATDLENIEKLCAYLEVDINEIYHPDYHDTKVLCMLNNKGGCGKTSLCSGIATSMAELGLRILVIDGDGQRNLSSSFDMPRSEKNFGAAVLAEQDLNGYIQPRISTSSWPMFPWVRWTWRFLPRSAARTSCAASCALRR